MIAIQLTNESQIYVNIDYIVDIGANGITPASSQKPTCYISLNNGKTHWVNEDMAGLAKRIKEARKQRVELSYPQ